MITKPERLRQGDTIGIIAPASPVTHDEIQPAIQIIEQKGYRVLEGLHLYTSLGYLAGSDEDRLDDLHGMFKNSKVKAILCARGGYGTPRLLDKINYDIIKKNPKLFIGYSDITALLLAINHKTGLATCHGPMAKNKKNSEDNLSSLLDLISSENKTNFSLVENNVIKKGKADGRLLGGNLSLISSLQGTPFLPSFKDCILFIEESGEPLYRIDRMLTQLKLGGVLEGIRGLIAGSFEECGDIAEINRLLLEAAPAHCPVYSGFPAGHGEDNQALPFGTKAVLDTKGLSLTVEPFVD